jgi:hypothetical protein
VVIGIADAVELRASSAMVEMIGADFIVFVLLIGRVITSLQ